MVSNPQPQLVGDTPSHGNLTVGLRPVGIEDKYLDISSSHSSSTTIALTQATRLAAPKTTKVKHVKLHMTALWTR